MKTVVDEMQDLDRTMDNLRLPIVMAITAYQAAEQQVGSLRLQREGLLGRMLVAIIKQAIPALPQGVVAKAVTSVLASDSFFASWTALELAGSIRDRLVIEYCEV